MSEIASPASPDDDTSFMQQALRALPVCIAHCGCSDHWHLLWAGLKATGMLRGLLDSRVGVGTRGGELTIAWEGEGRPVWMTGPAVTVFEGEMEI